MLRIFQLLRHKKADSWFYGGRIELQTRGSRGLLWTIRMWWAVFRKFWRIWINCVAAWFQLVILQNWIPASTNLLICAEKGGKKLLGLLIVIQRFIALFFTSEFIFNCFPTWKISRMKRINDTLNGFDGINHMINFTIADLKFKWLVMLLYINPCIYLIL